MSKQHSKAIFTFGRYQPPTKGHEMVFDFMTSISIKEKRTMLVFPSKTEGDDKNPIPFAKKMDILDSIFPDILFITDKEVKNPFDSLYWLEQHGYDDVIMVVGGDRIEEFTNRIMPYINNGDPEKEYNFNEFDIISAGQRNNGSSIEGISSSLARNHVANNDFKSFHEVLPSKASKNTTILLFNIIKTYIDKE